MLLDGNAAVVANACAALLEISRFANKKYLKFKNNQNLNKLLTALNDCNEWGQVYVLEGISMYDAANSKEAEMVIERVLPRLAHSNPAVILSSVRVILKNMDYIDNTELLKGIVKKLAAPLVTLLNQEPEIKYVALRNINFVL